MHIDPPNLDILVNHFRRFSHDITSALMSVEANCIEELFEKDLNSIRSFLGDPLKSSCIYVRTIENGNIFFNQR